MTIFVKSGQVSDITGRHQDYHWRSGVHRIKRIGNWLVRAYDVDGNYAGTWIVPETEAEGMVAFAVEQWRNGRLSRRQVAEDVESYLERFSTRIVPYDDNAKAVTASGDFARMPRRPAFLAEFGDPKTQIVQIVQSYIAQLSSTEAKGLGFSPSGIWMVVRSFRPLEWYVSYDASGWYVSTKYDEETLTIYIEAGGTEFKYFWVEPDIRRGKGFGAGC